MHADEIISFQKENRVFNLFTIKDNYPKIQDNWKYNYMRGN
jgi:hypothetical protein